MPTLQAEQLTHAQTDESRDQHEHPIAVTDAFGNVPHLLRTSGRDRTFRGPLDTRAADDARVAQDQLVSDGGSQDRADEPVALGCGVRPESGSDRETGLPLAHRLGRQLRQLGRTELRVDVGTQLMLLELARPRAQVGLVREPLVGVFLEGNSTCARIHPVSSAFTPSSRSRMARAARAGHCRCARLRRRTRRRPRAELQASPRSLARRRCRPRRSARR